MLRREVGGIGTLSSRLSPPSFMNVRVTFAAVEPGFCSKIQVSKGDWLLPSARYQVAPGDIAPAVVAPSRRKYIARSARMGRVASIRVLNSAFGMNWLAYTGRRALAFSVTSWRRTVP